MNSNVRQAIPSGAPAGVGSDLADKRLSVTLVTLAGTTHFNKSYTRPCIRSWSRITNAAPRPHLMDSGLAADDFEALDELGIERESVDSEAVLDRLRRYPVLQSIRSRFVTWRKIVDPICLFQDHEYVQLIDTDVFIAGVIAIPAGDYDFIYQCEDVPAYRGRWTLPFREPMLPALNAGFVLFRPAAVDLDFLEHLAARYFAQAKNFWWTVQSAWSVVIARSKSRRVFDGRDVRVISGNYKRSPAEVCSNKVKVWGSNRLVETEEGIWPYLEGGAVLHFAGKGKRWVPTAERIKDPWPGVRLLRANDVANIGIVQKCATAVRMLIK